MEDILGIDINITKNKQNSGTNTHQAEISNYQEFLSRREAKGADEATSLVTLLAELRLGEGSTFNSTTGKQLQELNNINCHAEFISASSHLQAVTTPETQNDHLQEHTGGQILNKIICLGFTPRSQSFAVMPCRHSQLNLFAIRTHFVPSVRKSA